MYLSEQIKKLRKEMGLTQHQLAERLGVTKSVISKAETGMQLSEALLAKLAANLPQLAEAVQEGIGRQPRRREAQAPQAVRDAQTAQAVRSQAYEARRNGQQALRENAYEQARELLAEAGRLYETLSDSEDLKALALTHNLLGECEMQRGEWAQARMHFKQALTLYSDFEDMSQLATTLINLGWNSRVEKRFAVAAGLFRSARAIAEEINEERITARALFYLALVQQNEFHYAAAMDSLTKSLHIREQWARKQQEAGQSVEADDKAAIVEIQFNIGLTKRLQEDIPGALACYRDCLLRLQELRRPALTSTILINIADAAAAAGKARSAAQILSAATTWREAKGIKTIPVNKETYQRIHDRIQDAMKDTKGEEDYALAISQGAKMTLESAVDLALRDVLDDIR